MTDVAFVIKPCDDENVREDKLAWKSLSFFYDDE